ncbi:MAG: hypothetical protein JO261_01430 [Alphaproteobacteria bacterium]|nr:hypothetical protein [Alphaproteobacteria bacterium]MBV9692338.1 hypothetical protein [Alphaproteobacteria bacterium]
MAARRTILLGLCASLALTGTLATGASARLHYPLPPDSTAVNGVAQQKVSHARMPAQEIRLAPLPDKGLHPGAALWLKRPYAGTPTDVLRYHNDNYPTGWNPNETDLTPASVASASFGQITTLNVDGNVMAEPLLVSNFQMPDNSTHDVLIVATGHDTIYAYDAQTYAVLWQRSLGTPQSTGDVGCSDIKPEYGISSTPVIVRSAQNAATIYVVAATEPAHLSFHTKLHAIDLGTGKDLMRPHEIAPAASLETGGKIHFDPQNQWSRSSLAYANGAIYMGIGSHCDSNAGAISGWVLRYDAATLQLTGKFNTIEAAAGYELSSVWMSGYSVALDPAGNVYAITGNGNYSLTKGHKGYGESVIALAPDLNRTPIGTFTPSNWQSLNNGDTDFGSGGAMLLPVAPGQTAPPMLVGMGKAGTMYLLDASSLRGLEGQGGYQALQKIQLSACWCGAAYYAGPAGGVVYYQGNGDLLRAFSVAIDGTPSLTQVAASSDGAGSGGAFPVVSSNGATSGTAVVWAIERGNPTEQIKAYNAATLGAPLFAANAGNWSNGSRSYLTPLVANGRVYVGAFKTVTVFGLTN